MWSLLELHKKYGNVVRISPTELSWVDAGIFKDVFANRQGHEEFMKGNEARQRHPNGHYGILGAERATHARFRRNLSHAFSEKGMKEQQPHIVEYVDLLMNDLKKHAKEGPQDMVKWFNWTTFDVIGKLTFGEDFGCLKNSELHPWIAIIFGNLKAITIINSIKVLGFGWIVPYLISKGQMADIKYNFKFASDKIHARVAKGQGQNDFWDHVLEKAGADTKTGMSVDEMVSNASNLILAGSETTATLLSGVIYYLCQDADAMSKITKEIRSAYTSDAEIDLFSTGELKYTLAVLEESMRIYTPVPTQGSRVVPAGGDTVLDHFLPGGTIIHFSQHVAHHLPSNFVKPEEFHPERFLGAEKFKNDNFAVMQPFSVGARNCIGKNLAYAEMRLILAKFLWNFDVEFDQAKMGEGKAWLDQKTFIL